MFESSKFDKSGGHIRPGLDLKKKNGGAGYDIQCNPSFYRLVNIDCTCCSINSWFLCR